MLHVTNKRSSTRYVVLSKYQFLHKVYDYGLLIVLKLIYLVDLKYMFNINSIDHMGLNRTFFIPEKNKGLLELSKLKKTVMHSHTINNRHIFVRSSNLFG